jgi:transcriptional regulator with XRE-family HTH domain
MYARTTQELVVELLGLPGETQASIAAETGLTQPTISRIAAGEHKNPSLDTHNRIVAYARRRLRRKARQTA